MDTVTLKKIMLAVAGICAFLLIGVGEWPLVATVAGAISWAVYALL